MHEQLFLLAHVFDGRRFLARPMTVRTRGAFIDEVADGHPESHAAGVEVHDLRDKVLVPGLINTHVHMARAGMFAPSEPPSLVTILSNLRTTLASGTTTVGDMGCPYPVARELVGIVSEDVAAGPDIRVSGPILTCPKGYPFDWMPPMFRFFHTAIEVDDGSSAKRIVERLANKSVHHIKIAIMHRNYGGVSMPALDRVSAKAIVEEAHALGLKVYAHAHGNADYDVALAAGADALAHSSFDPLTDDLVQRVRDQGLPVCPTLFIFDSLCFGCETRLDRDPEMRKSASTAVTNEWAKFAEAYAGSGDRLPAGIAGGLPKAEVLEAVRVASANLTLLRDRGVPISFGNDGNYGFARINRPIDELRCMAKSGLTDEEVLTSATSSAASYLGLDDRGSIAQGMLADFVVLSEWKGLDSLASPSAVMRRGKWVTDAPRGNDVRNRLRIAKGMLKSTVF